MDFQTIGRPMEILLVEDSMVDARITAAAIRKANFRHRLTVIRDGLTALQFLNRQEMYVRAPCPDLVLLDLRLPHLDGLEVLEEIKKSKELRSIPVVVTTSSIDEEDMLECQFQGADGFLTKPIDQSQFLTQLQGLNVAWKSDVILPFADPTQPIRL